MIMKNKIFEGVTLSAILIKHFEKNCISINKNSISNTSVEEKLISLDIIRSKDSSPWISTEWVEDPSAKWIDGRTKRLMERR